MSLKYRRSRTQLSNDEVPIANKSPRPVVIVADATFFGKRMDKFGILVFRDNIFGEVIKFKAIDTEKIQYYVELHNELIIDGYSIKSITVDGRRVLFQAFRSVPIQMCHFHQQMIITQYFTKNPRLKASIDLKRISRYLGTISEYRFHLLLAA